MPQQYDNQYPIALSGGSLLIPGMQEKLVSKLKAFKVVIPDDPVMSNANDLTSLRNDAQRIDYFTNSQAWRISAPFFI